jgi:AbrB family looped-hinge helix DNA binding protein
VANFALMNRGRKEPLMEIWTQISKSGRIIVPANLRKALEIQAGDEILLRLENDSIRLFPLRQAVAQAQKKVRRYVPEGVSLVDTLIQQRRE